MRISLTLAQQGFVLILIPLAFQLIFVGTLAYMLRQAEAEIKAANHARDVVEGTDALARKVMTYMEMIRDFNPAQVPETLANIGNLNRETKADVARLKELVKGNQVETQNVEQAELAVNDASKMADTITDAVKQGNLSQAAGTFWSYAPKMEPTLRRLIKVVKKLVAYEKEIQKAAPGLQETSRRNLEIVLGIFVAFNCALAVFFTVIFNRGTAARLDRLLDNVGRLSRQEELNRPLEGEDELSRLDRAFYQMAEYLNIARQRETAIVDRASDAIASIDPEGRFLQINPAGGRLLGWEPHKLIGSSILEHIMPEKRPKAFEFIQALKGGEKMAPLETRFKRRDGMAVDVLWSANWSDADEALYCVIHNITERKEIEQMKQEFVAMVSHDLRTPLTSVKTCLALFETGNFGELTDDGKRFLTMADNNIDRLIGLVNGLLDIERMTSGKLELDCAPTRLAEIVEQSVAAVVSYAEQQRIKLVPQVTDAPLVADSGRLVQVVINLVSNAIKFSPKDSQIVVFAKPIKKAVEFRISDQGRGIPEELRVAIFERFRQVEQTDATRHGGAGLGLSICKGIVDAHGGSIGVESEVGKGSTFWFRIPESPPGV